MVGKTDLSQNNLEKSELGKVSDWKNLALTHDPTKHDAGHPKVRNEWCFNF